MKRSCVRQSLAAAVSILASGAFAGETLTDTFARDPQSRWTFVADTVMGGVSSGQVVFENEGNESLAHLTGQVSTENRGGFIQFRRAIDGRLKGDLEGVRLIARGNNQPYYVHLRTGGMVLPWQYYQGSFEASSNWTEIRIPFSAFEASGRMLRSSVQPASITSIGVVAYGRDHQADVKIREIGFY